MRSPMTARSAVCGGLWRRRRTQALGKIERFWGSLWRGCVETAVFLGLGEARLLFIDSYNFQRPHQGIEA